MSLKRVALFINNLNAGGCERTAAFLLNKFQSSVEWHLIMFSDQVHYPIPNETNIHILKVEEKGWRRLLFPFKINGIVRSLENCLKAQEIDTLFVFNHLPAAIGGRLKSSGWNGSFIINEQIHCSSYISGINNPLKRWIKNYEIKKYYPLSDNIIVNAKGIANDLHEHFGIQQNKLVLINNPLDLETIRGLKNEKLNFEKDPDDFVFIHVGRYEPQKNHQLLIEAFSKLEIPKTKLWLIGGGSSYSEIEKMIQSLGQKERIIQWGVQKNPFKFLNCSDVFVLSSDFEGFPNVLLEAMACNLPIVSTNCKSGPAELLSPDNSINKNPKSLIEICAHGILTQVGDPEGLAVGMKKIFSDKGLRENFREKSKDRLHEFKASEVLKKFERIILQQNKI